VENNSDQPFYILANGDVNTYIHSSNNETSSKTVLRVDPEKPYINFLPRYKFQSGKSYEWKITTSSPSWHLLDSTKIKLNSNNITKATTYFEELSYSNKPKSKSFEINAYYGGKIYKLTGNEVFSPIRTETKTELDRQSAESYRSWIEESKQLQEQKNLFKVILLVLAFLIILGITLIVRKYIRKLKKSR
jgi:hypothetical protein